LKLAHVVSALIAAAAAAAAAAVAAAAFVVCRVSSATNKWRILFDAFDLLEHLFANLRFSPSAHGKKGMHLDARAEVYAESGGRQYSRISIKYL
jgi:hypothetical protein